MRWNLTRGDVVPIPTVEAARLARKTSPDTEASFLNSQKPVTVSSSDKEAGPPLPQSKEMEASCCELLKLMAKWAPLKERDERLVKLPENPSLMPRLAPPLPVESVPQSNFPVDESQLRVSPGTSQSPSSPPSLSGRLKAEMEAVPDTSKLLVTEARPLIKVISVIESFKVTA